MLLVLGLVGGVGGLEVEGAEQALERGARGHQVAVQGEAREHLLPPALLGGGQVEHLVTVEQAIAHAEHIALGLAGVGAGVAVGAAEGGAAADGGVAVHGAGEEDALSGAWNLHVLVQALHLLGGAAEEPFVSVVADAHLHGLEVVADAIHGDPGAGACADILLHEAPDIDALGGHLHDHEYQDGGDGHGGHQLDEREAAAYRLSEILHGLSAE